MRICPSCEASSVDTQWLCARCSYQPQFIDGFLSFAPEHVATNEGFNPALHASLNASQAGSFWFRSRNKLIRYLIQKYLPNSSNILEVGCGTGFVLDAIQSAIPGAKVSGSEIHPAALQFAAKKVSSDTNLYQMDARRIPFESEFDLICAFDVLEHIEEDDVVLSQMWRSLSPDGGLLIAVPQHPWLWSRADELASHKRRYRRGELEAKCRNTGFEIIFTTSFVTSLLPLMALQRKTRGKKMNFEFRSEMQLAKGLDRILEVCLSLETALIRSGTSLPVGGSRFIIAKKLPLAQS